MKFSYNWIQEHIEEKLPTPSQMRDSIVFHAFEVEEMETVGNDTVLDIKVLPDRASDCLSHAGMAREIAGMLNLTYKEPPVSSLPAATTAVPVELQSDQCNAYTAVRIDNVKVGPSPEWLRTKLESIGQRSINTIVDATNYVLFDVGQPVHTFDASEVDGGIIVRSAHAGETITLLGGEEKKLNETDLVIADYMGALAIAGVKGGASAEVSDETTSIIIEVANFDPIAVRKTSRRLGLITDASKRFENNVSPALIPASTGAVVALILSLAGGTVSAYTEAGTTTVTPRTVSFQTNDITRLLGASITKDHIVDVLTRYHYTYTNQGDDFILTVPFWRPDIAGAHDIAEEVGRVVGYEHIPPAPLPFVPVAERNNTDARIAAVRSWAIQEGYREVYTYTFRPKGEVVVAYGAKGKDKLRTNLSDGLKESYERNRLNAPLLGMTEMKLFEVGTVFSASGEEIHVAVCDRGSIQELPIDECIKENNIDLNAVPVVALTDPHPFHPWSTYPFITRDIAVWVSGEENTKTLEMMVREFASKHCIREPQLFDTFTKDGRTSVAYRLVFQSFDKTLTDEEVTATLAALTDAIAANDAFEIR